MGTLLGGWGMLPRGLASRDGSRLRGLALPGEVTIVEVGSTEVRLGDSGRLCEGAGELERVG